MSQPDQNPEGGYFLTDALVGLFILASVAGSLLGAFGLARVAAGQADHSAKALVIAKACVEQPGQGPGVREFQLSGVRYEQVRLEDVKTVRDQDVVEIVKVSCLAKWIDRGASKEVLLERLEARARRR